MDIVAILILSVIILIPYSVIMTAIAIFGTSQKWRSAQQMIKNLEDKKVKEDSKSRMLLATYILSSLMVIGALLCGIIIMIMYYMNPTSIDTWVSFEKFQIAIIGFLLSVALVGIVLGVFGKYVIKKFFEN